MYIIYKISNNINSKVYIGSTKNELSKRWRVHLHSCKKSHHLPLYIDMNLLGCENFKIEAICVCESDTEMAIKENAFISMYKSLQPNGYNTNTRAYLSKKYQSKMVKAV